MAIVTKITFLFNGSKVDAMGPMGRVSSTRPGGVAQGADGPIDQYAGEGETHSIENITLRFRPSGLAFKPWLHTRPGQEFDVSYNEGDPAFGGSTITMTRCLCEGQVTERNNENGDIVCQIPRIRPVLRIGD